MQVGNTADSTPTAADCTWQSRRTARHRSADAEFAASREGKTDFPSLSNNILEPFFHRLKHGERRRNGRKVLPYDFEAIPPGAALACNLRRPDYVTLVSRSLDELPARFNAIDAAADRTVLPDPAPELTRAALPLGDRRPVRRPAFRPRLLAACSRRQP